MSRRYINESYRNRSIPHSSCGEYRLQPRAYDVTNDNNRKLDDPMMIIDGADGNSSTAEDVHVRELRRMFDSCDEDGDGALTTSGLERLCGELRLDDHKEYIISQLLPSNSVNTVATIGFESFKLKFIQLLPDLVDFSSVAEKNKTRSASASPLPGGKNLRLSTGNIDLSLDGVHSRSATANRRSNHDHQSNRAQEILNSVSRPIAAPRRKLTSGMAAADGPMVASDEDTSNDILSEFSDDERNRQNKSAQKRKSRSSLVSDSAASSNASSRQQSPFQPSQGTVPPAEGASSTPAGPMITAADVEQILTGLGLADRGYLGRYEFRILCQHLGLNGLSPAELNGLFNQLDKDGDGRIAVDDFLQVSLNPSTHSQGHQRQDQTTDGSIKQKQAQCREGGSAREQRSHTPAASATSIADPAQLTANGSSNYDPPANPLPRNVTEKLKNVRMEAVTLLASLDEGRTGHAKRDDVLAYWETLGIDDGCGVLKKLGFTERQRWIDLRELSTAMDRELCESVEQEFSLLAAVLTLKAEVCFLKESFDESREQAAHYLRELQQLNQRNAILVEEMDQSQQNLEIRAQMQFKELEEKHHCRISQLEGKYREEREQWHSEMKEKEEFLHKLEQAETTLHSRIRQMERENTKLKTEVNDLTQMMKDVEDLNRDLRQALKEATTFKKQQPLHGDEALRHVVAFENGSRAGLVIQRSSASGRSVAAEAGTGCLRCASTSSTPAKKRHKYTPPSTSALLKRRRLQLQHHHLNRRISGGALRPLDSSDFESEPEPIIFKPKFKRPLKKRQRLALIANRHAKMYGEFDAGNTLYSGAPMAVATTSSSEEERHGPPALLSRRSGVHSNGADLAKDYFTAGANGNWDNHLHQFASVERRLSDERKFYAQELKMEIAAMEEEHSREARRLLERFEREKEQMRNDCKREIDSLLHSHASEKRSALEMQETELRKQFESQRRDAEIKWATERNIMERRFAEEKMEMMERLQNDFEEELNRVRRSATNRSPDSSASPSMENRLRFEQALQENLQLNARLEAILTELRTVNEQLNSERNRCAEMDERIGGLQQQTMFWENKYNDVNRENSALHDEVKRLKRDLQDVSAEYTILQQRAEEWDNRCRQEACPVNSSDVDVQTDGSLVAAVKDESVQLESSSLDNVSGVGPAVALVTYEKCRKTLVKDVNELELLLQSAESGFEEEIGTEDNENDPALMKTICGKLRNKLSRAQAKFEAIRKSLLSETACLNQLSSNCPATRPHSAPNLAATSRETQTDDEAEMRGHVMSDVQEDGDFEIEENELVLNDEIEEHFASALSPIAMAHVTERLKDENFLLRARLVEQKRLTGELTGRLQQQMKDTVKVSEVVQKLFARCKSLETEQNKKQRVL